jgi:tRNA threonylcarbamoyladenosine dehydratase
MSFDLSSHKTQLVLTALAASAATAGVISAYANHSKRQKRRSLNDDVLRSLAAHEGKGKTPLLPDPSPPLTGRATPQVAPALNGAYSEELIREQLARNYAFFGEDGMARIRRGRVVVVGCGGVGSWAAVMLVRS